GRDQREAHLTTRFRGLEKGPPDERRKRAAVREVRARQLGRGTRVTAWICEKAFDRGPRLAGIAEREQAVARRYVSRPAGLLDDGRAPQREETRGAIAEPSARGPHVR